MDISETYIKMCEQAKEIQVLRTSPFESSWSKFQSCGDVFSDGEEVIDNWFLDTPPQERPVWLPRQDQLQEMVIDRDTTIPVGVKIAGLFGSFYEDFYCSGKFNIYNMTSLEQLWLAFVMKEKYNKVWNGEDWVCG